MRNKSRIVSMLIVLLWVLSPLKSAAQSSLSATDAAAFMGVWALGLETPQGALTMNLTLKDDGGKVAGSISAEPIMPEPQAITDIAKDGGNLVLRYTLDVQGQSIPAKISLVPDGENWKVTFDFADGQFVMDGTASKK